MISPARPPLRSLRRLAATTAASARRTATVSRPVSGPAARLAAVATSHPSLCLCRYASSTSSPPAPPSPPQATATATTTATTPPPSFPVTLDIRHVRENVDLHAENCRRRNYGALAGHPARIVELFGQWQARQRDGRALREEANHIRRHMVDVPGTRAAEEGRSEEHERYEGVRGKGASEEEAGNDRDSLLDRARELKRQLATIKADEAQLAAEMQRLAAALPNLTSAETPGGEEPATLSYINCDGDGDGGRALATPDRWRSHVHIGAELGLLEFSAASAASGWGWYYLLGDAARLEQALVQYALAVAHRHGWRLVSPPSVVRSSVAAACGFQPRDQGGEQQTYALEGLPLSLTATAEIPLAALYADATLDAALPESEGLPVRRAAASRCYRAEAGARGANTKGLYRVHEFTKVELFAWTAPDLAAATEAFDELVDVQTEVLSGLGLPCRVLEMPAADLGASAFRKIDIEAFFPSRCRPKTPGGGDEGAGNAPDDYDLATGWGEVTSASICTDYQTRRLATRARLADGQLAFPWTINGTALAVPRVLAALLENGWDEETMTVAIPECLQPWMDGQATLGVSRRV